MLSADCLSKNYPLYTCMIKNFDVMETFINSTYLILL